MKATFIIILLLILWFYIDFRLGASKQSKKEKRAPMQPATGSLSLFTSGNELITELFRDIEGAKHHVHILFYLVKKDQISYRFLKLLKKKAEAGIDVRLMIDWSGSLFANKSILADLKNSGVKVAFCKKPALPYLFYSLHARNHRKIAVIDGSVGYLGGFNIGKEYIDMDPKLSPWRDYHLRIAGQAVAGLQDIFFADWQEASGEHVQYGDVFTKPGLKGEHVIRLMPTEPYSLENEFVSLLKQANSEIIIGTPYFIPTRPLMDELKSALARGVQVQILVPVVSDHLLVKEAAYPYFRELLPLGAKIHQFQNGFFHGKYILIDDQLLDIGTANFDKRSVLLNNEINCYIYDQPCILQFKEKIMEDIRNSLPVSVETLQSVGVWTRCKERLGQAISIFL